jgi:hypothetical protein
MLAKQFLRALVARLVPEARGQAAVVFEFVCAVVNVNASSLADELIVGAFIDVLKPTPPTYVVDQNAIKIRAPTLHVVDQLLEAVSLVYGEAAAAFVSICSNDVDVALASIARDHSRLIFRRILLIVGGHAHVLRRPAYRV